MMIYPWSRWYKEHFSLEICELKYEIDEDFFSTVLLLVGSQ